MGRTSDLRGLLGERLFGQVGLGLVSPLKVMLRFKARLQVALELRCVGRGLFPPEASQ